MKLFYLSFIAFIFFGTNNLTSQTFDKNYSRIDVYNSSGSNIHDFIFSYDVIEGNHTCTNNFKIRSNIDYKVTFRFKIYFNNKRIYTGSATTDSQGTVYFNDAFIHCAVLSAKIKIVVL